MWRIARRFIAVLGMLALGIAYLPGVVDALSPELPSCCDGIMCPMHHVVDGRVMCDMQASQQNSKSLTGCPDYGVRYAASIVFVRVSPPVVYSESLSGEAASPAPALPPSFDIAVLSPPPRALFR